MQAVLGAELRCGTEGMQCTFSAVMESYSNSNTGRVFWIQRRNFWLDGDRVTVAHLPFLDSRGCYDVGIAFRWNGEEDGSYPRGDRLLLSILQRGDTSNPCRVVREALLRGRRRVYHRLDAVADLRYVRYGHEEWSGCRDHASAFIGLQSWITGDLWVSIGTGVNPYSFDRWLYRYTRFGREKYLLDRGLYELMDSLGRKELMDAIRKAEASLAEDWIITFEAGIHF
jgi:hypothetical protein